MLNHARKGQFPVSGIFRAGGILDNKKSLRRNYPFNFRAKFSLANKRISARSENSTDWKSALSEDTRDHWYTYTSSCHLCINWTWTGFYLHLFDLILGTRIPFSLAGIKLPLKSMSSWMYRTKGVLVVSEELNDALKTGHNFCKMKEACKESRYTKTENQFILQQNLFLRSHLHSLSSILPKWLRVRMKHGYSGFNVNNIQSMILRSNRMRILKDCQHFPVNTNPTSIFAAQVIFAPLTLQALGMHVETESSYPTCIATDLCTKTTYVSLPQDKTVNFTPYLRSLGVKNLSVRLHGVGFAANNRIQRDCFTRYGYEDSLCIDAPVWIKVSSNFGNEVANISLEGEAFIGTKELSKVFFWTHASSESRS